MDQQALEPADKIEAALGALVFYLGLVRLIENGNISPDSFRSPGSSLPAEGVTVNPMTFTDGDLRVHATNAMTMMVGTTAIAVDSALDVCFGKANEESDSEISHIRAVIHQVRNCFAHQPLNPVWKIFPKHRRVYEVTLPNGNYRSIDLSNLDDESFKLEDIGGLNVLIGICMTAHRVAGEQHLKT